MGLTQVQVSKLTRINKTTISEIENGRLQVHSIYLKDC
ncbi:helix-turn-helix domain-containing protein [Aliivibrio wodanis]